MMDDSREQPPGNAGVWKLPLNSDLILVWVEPAEGEEASTETIFLYCNVQSNSVIQSPKHLNRGKGRQSCFAKLAQAELAELSV